MLFLFFTHRLNALNISWTHMDSECVRAVVENIPINLMRLNVAGCRKSMTDECKLHSILFSILCPIHCLYFVVVVKQT